MPQLRGAALEAWAPVAGGAALKAQAPVPWLRGAELEVQAPVAGIAPSIFVTGSAEAGGNDAEAGVAVSLRRPGIWDDVLGGKLSGEAAIEAGRR